MLMTAHPRRQAGFGLVELMIGLLVGMIVVGAAVSLLSTTMASSNDSIKMTRLDQELRQAMTMLTRDLRRATIWDPATDVLRVSLSDPLKLSAKTGSGVTVTSIGGNLDEIGAKAIGGTLIYSVKESGVLNVYRGRITAYSDSDNGTYTVTLTDTWPADVVPAGNWNILRPESTVTTDAVPGTPGACVLIIYDTDISGTYTNAPNEFFGYRYDGAEKALEVRNSSTGTCDPIITTGWENLTDERTVEITDFKVTDNSPGVFPNTNPQHTISIAIREYTISMTGRLKADPSVERTIQETVRVRNDRLI